jgi:hypothetical protein
LSFLTLKLLIYLFLSFTVAIFALQFIRRNPPKGVNATPLRPLSLREKTYPQSSAGGFSLRVGITQRLL